MAALTEPWSKRHKAVTKNDREGLQYNLSNSFAQPTSQAELERLATERGDDELEPTFGRVRIDDGSRSPSPAEETAKIWDRMFCTFDTSVLVCPGIGPADDDDEEGLRVPWAPS